LVIDDMPPVSDIFTAHLDAVRALQQQEQEIVRIGEVLVAGLRRGQRIFLCGNGGSAADAQHIATEMVCRFETERPGLAAIALTTDTSALTAISNDFGYERVFARQLEALGRRGDILVAISTSGNSGNVIRAVEQAGKAGITSVGLLGRDGGRLAQFVDHPLIVPAGDTARIQECHILIGHIWCAMVDAAFG
jgi:phosphoheptose isomerase